MTAFHCSQTVDALAVFSVTGKIYTEEHCCTDVYFALFVCLMFVDFKNVLYPC